MDAVGRHVRFLRKERGWTLRELAQRCELSTSFISQVERNLCSISISSLDTICQALGLTLADFFLVADGSSGDGLVPRRDMEVMMAEDQPAVILGDAMIKYRFLSRWFWGRKIEVIIGEIAPGYDYPPALHEGEEFGYVLEGRLRLTIDDRVHHLGPGDSYHFGPHTPHGYAADGDVVVKVLWVGTLLGFRRRDGWPMHTADA